jgi:hypothetical protein
MWRTLRAFAWMRWRVLVNALERSGARDRLERLSLALEQLGPIIAFALIVPSTFALAGLGAYAGYRLSSGEPAVSFDVVRYLLFAAITFCVVGPLLMPSMERTSAIRLLLLPISRRTLYLAQAAGTVSEPWILLAIPLVTGLPFGLAAGGALVPASVAIVAGLLFIVCLTGIAALSTTALNLVVRDRRRGELLTLLFVVFVPIISLVPGMLMQPALKENSARRSERRAPAEPAPSGEVTFNNRALRAARRTSQALPSELYVRAARSPLQGQAGSAVAALAALAGITGALHGAGLLLFGRLLSGPGSTTRSRTRASGDPLRWTLPGLSRPAAAVAQATLRLAMRTPRGRSIVLSPLLVFVAFAVMVRRAGSFDLGMFQLTNGLGVATFGAVVCLISILPFAMNQFAIDRAGLTLSLLAPLETRALLDGKSAGLGMMVAGPIAACLVVSYALFPSGSAAAWISVPIALWSIYLLVAPVAAALSAVFPRAVDLNSIGRGSNAHGVAGTLGLLAFGVASVPPALLAGLSLTVLGRPALLPLLMLAWCGVAFIVNRLLFRAVAVLVDKRRENLALVV